MLKSIVITNSFGEVAEYKIDGVQPENTSGFLITSITGLGPGKATINMSETATADGSIYSSARLEGKNIVIKGRFTSADSIEEARRMSYKVFPIKDKVDIEVMTDSSDIALLHISGYVESNEPDIFSDASGSQISIKCESAYFDGGDMNWVIDSDGSYVVNNGDVDTGVTISFEPINGNANGEISILKSNVKGSQSMTFDTTRFADIVPDTSPHNAFLEKLVFGSSGGTEDYLCWIPQDKRPVTQTGAVNSNYATTMCGDVLHVIDFNVPTGSDVIQSDVTDEWKRHMGLSLAHGVYVMYGIDDPNIDMSYVRNASSSNKKNMWQHGIATFDGKIHLVSRLFKDAISINGGTYLAHKVWDPNEQVWRLIDDNLPLIFSEIVEHSSSSVFEFRIQGMMEYEQELHMFASLRYTSGSTICTELQHRVWDDDRNYWDPVSVEYILDNQTESESGIPMDIFKGIHSTPADKAFSTSFDGNKIHFFYEQYDKAGTSSTSTHHHITWDSVNGYSYSFEPPAAYYNNLPAIYGVSEAIIVPFAGSIHVLGGYNHNNNVPLGWHYHYDVETNEWVSDEDLSYSYSNRGVQSGVSAGYAQIFLVGNGLYNQTHSEIDNSIRLMEHDTLEVCTIRGRKSVTLYRGNKKYNVLKSMKKGSEWITVNNGNNYFEPSGDVYPETGELSTTVSVKPLFQGV